MTANETADAFFQEWNLRDCRKTASKKVPAPHQELALGKLRSWYSDLKGASGGGILVLPTGGGKTFTAIHFLCSGPISDGYKVLWLAPTHHLLEQAFHSFEPGLLGHIREPRPSIRLRVVSSTPGHYPPRSLDSGDDVVIATLQTMTNAYRKDLKQFHEFVNAASDKLFVVFDEAHHSPAPSYRKLILHLQAAGAPVLGLTATPTYSHEAKKGWLKKLFPQGIVAQARPSDLIAQQILAKPCFERAETNFNPNFDESDYQRWLGTYRDIPDDVIDQLARNAERNALVAQTYASNRARWGKTIIFADRWFQCEAIVESLKKYGIAADAVYAHVDAPMSSVEGRRRRTRDENAKVLERFRNNDIDVLVNIRMLTEGTDLPDAQTVFLTRQTTSQILFTQMIGRALRGPKFGGTVEANIVYFADSWQQFIHWAEYDQLADTEVGEDGPPSPQRPPIHLISIDLVKRLARQMADGANVAPGPFVSLMPVGWYRVTFDVCLADSDEIETREELVLVFDDEREGFEKLVKALLKGVPSGFENEHISLDDHRHQVEEWRAQYLAGVGRTPGELLRDIFHVGRHFGQGHGTPAFFPFEVVRDHDLDELANDIIERDLGPRSKQAVLEAEFLRQDRFWRALFQRFEVFQHWYDGCEHRALAGPERSADPAPARRIPYAPTEVTDAVKEQVKLRDGECCLCCGGRTKLQVDHIVPVYRGGTDGMDNLQTLCKVCNRTKGEQTIRFTIQRTPLSSSPEALGVFDRPQSAGARDRDIWDTYLRRCINFAFQCAAVSSVTIGGKGHNYHNWSIDLAHGNPPLFLKEHLAELVEAIQKARINDGKPELQSLSITSPGEDSLSWP